MSAAQLRMARAALQLTMRQFGAAVGLSAMAIARYERGDRSVMSVETAERLATWLEEQGVFFGPADGVCLKKNTFADERFFGNACWQLLHEHRIFPSSRELIEAHTRLKELRHDP